MQNYAKFESRVWWSLSQDMDSGYMQNIGYGNSDSSMYEMIWNVVYAWIYLILWIVFIIWSFYMFYLVVSLFSRWWKETIGEMKDLLMWFYNVSIKSALWVISILKIVFSYIWNRKIMTVSLVILFFFIVFLLNVIGGRSKILRLIKVEPGFVWVDLRNDKLMEPWYHLHSDLFSDFFLSSTDIFNFEIVEVTANTKEDMSVVLDYRLYFKLEKNKSLDFYSQYGKKSIRQISSDIVMPRVLEALKWVIRNYWFKEISSNHLEIKTNTLANANIVLKPLGIVMQDINVLDIRLPKDYVDSIKKLQNSANDLKLAEAQLEKQKKEKERAKLQAESKKEVKIIEAEWIAKYNALISNNKVTDQILELKKLEIEKIKVEKWDGKLPTTVIGDEGTIKIR